MKKLLLIIVAAVAFFSTARAEKGDMAFGVNLLYGTEIESFGTGLKFQYSVLDQVRLEASFNYFFEHKEVHGWDLNLTGHYLFDLSDKFTVYPLAGLTIASAGVHGNMATKFGANLGGGCEFHVSPEWSVGAEVRYSIVADIDQAVLGIGATYKF